MLLSKPLHQITGECVLLSVFAVSSLEFYPNIFITSKVQINKFFPFTKEMWGSGRSNIELNYRGNMKAGTGSLWWRSS
jgi:hypothetical protein